MMEQAGSEGQRVGNYRLVRLLGRGGFAEVYLAEHIHLETQAAVKLLRTQLANEGIDDFRNEARMIAGLVHPHIVRVLDFGVEHSVPYLAMDYASNGTLRQQHPKGTRLPLPLVVSYVQQIAGALQYAHDKRLIHRDIKPENMLVGHNNEVLLSDFGIALIAQSSRYQSTQNVAGTIAYMAPEQIQAHPRPASDQYSLAVVVYEWLGGQRPFQGTMTEIAVKHATVLPPPLSSFVPTLSPAVEQVVLKALQKDPHNRFPSILAFAQALRQASGQISQPLASGFPMAIQNETATTWQQISLTQTPPPYETQSTSGPISAYQISHPGSSPLPGMDYPSYSTQPMPSQTRLPLPIKKEPRVSRRTAIVALAGSVVAVGGSSLAYYIFANAKKDPSRLPGQTSSTQTTPGSAKTPSETAIAPLMTFKDHTKTIWAAAWSPDGKYIASASDDGTAHVWSTANQQRILSYRSGIQPAQNDDAAYMVAWAPNSTDIAVGFSDGTVQVVNLASHKQIAAFSSAEDGDLPGALYAVSISPNGRYVAVAGFFSSDIQIFDMTTRSRVYSLVGHTDIVWSVAWSHNGKYIASGSSDATARIWDSNTGKVLMIYDKQQDDVRSVSWSRDDSRLASAGMSGPVYVWASDSGQTLFSYGKQDDFGILTVAWSHNGKYIASASGSDATTHVWDAQNGKLLRAFPAHAINSVSWSPDDSRIVTANNEVIQVWQI